MDQMYICSQRFSQFADMIVNNAFVSFKVVTPEAEKQLFSAVDPSFVFHQEKKDLVFLWRKKTILVVHKDLLFAVSTIEWE